jgi:hypothetical protein
MKTIAVEHRRFIETAWKGVKLPQDQQECIKQVFYNAWWSALNVMKDLGSAELSDDCGAEELQKLYVECESWIRSNILKLQVEEIFNAHSRS